MSSSKIPIQVTAKKAAAKKAAAKKAAPKKAATKKAAPKKAATKKAAPKKAAAKKAAAKKAGAKQPRRIDEKALLPRALAIHDASKNAQKKLERDLNLDTINCDGRLAYAVKSRIKSVHDILEKVGRKRKGSRPGTKAWNYEPFHLTDGCGFRVVTIFQDDIHKVVKQIIDMIKHDNGISAFVKDRVKEVIIYSNRQNEADELAQTTKDVVDQSGLLFQGDDGSLIAQIREPEHKKSGYSSIHIVAYVAVEMQQADGTMENRQHPVEIQIRDIFEEGWGEIDHALRYVQNRQDAILDENDELYKFWQPHLNALKTFADGCSQHATLIKKNAIDVQHFRTSQDETLSSDSGREIADELRKILPDEYSIEIEQIFEQLRFVKDSIDGVTHETYESTSQRFVNLCETTNNYAEIEMRNGKTVKYRLMMEAAFCLDITVENQRSKVISIYTDILEEYNNDVFANFRIARAYREDGNLDEAIRHIKLAEKNMDSDSSIHGTSFVRAAIPRNAGYVYWQKAEEMHPYDTHEKVMSELEQAVESTMEAQRRARHVDDGGLEQLKASNNIAYFVLRACEIGGDANMKVRNVGLQDAVNDLEQALSKCEVRDVFSLDTAMRCHGYMGAKQKERDSASVIAKHLHDMACVKAKRQSLELKEVQSFLRNDVVDIGLRAVSVIFPDRVG